MSEEIEVVELKELPKIPVAEPAKAEAPPKELSETEKEAQKKGWKPDGPKSAEEFLRAEPLYEELKQRGKEIKALRAQMDEAIKHISNLKRAGYEEKLEYIKQERANAIARSDVEAVDYLDEQLYAVKADIQNEQIQPAAHPEAVKFINKYKDVLSDPAFQAWVDVQDRLLGAQHLDPEDHMAQLEQKMHREFPHKFKPKEEETEAVAAVESDSRPVTTKKKNKYSFSDLNQAQKNMYKYLERHGGGLAPDEYIKQLVAMGDIQ